MASEGAGEAAASAGLGGGRGGLRCVCVLLEGSSVESINPLSHTPHPTYLTTGSTPLPPPPPQLLLLVYRRRLSPPPPHSSPTPRRAAIMQPLLSSATISPRCWPKHRGHRGHRRQQAPTTAIAWMWMREGKEGRRGRAWAVYRCRPSGSHRRLRRCGELQGWVGDRDVCVVRGMGEN